MNCAPPIHAVSGLRQLAAPEFRGDLVAKVHANRADICAWKAARLADKPVPPRRTTRQDRAQSTRLGFFC